MALTPLNVKKIFLIIGGFMVLISTGWVTRFQRKSHCRIICTESRDIDQNVLNLVVWNADFGIFFGNILGLDGFFFKSDFSVGTVSPSPSILIR